MNDAITRERVAAWICDLNSYNWPQDLPTPKDGATPEQCAVLFRALSVIVPYEEWIDVWQQRMGMDEASRQAFRERMFS